MEWQTRADSCKIQLGGDERPDESAPSRTSTRSPVKGQNPDPELLFEERLGKMMAVNETLVKDKKALEKELHDHHNRLARLKEHNVSPTGPLAHGPPMLTMNRILYSAN